MMSIYYMLHKTLYSEVGCAQLHNKSESPHVTYMCIVTDGVAILFTWLVASCRGPRSDHVPISCYRTNFTSIHIHTEAYSVIATTDYVTLSVSLNCKGTLVCQG